MRIVTFTETVTECDCCGKSELKGTYVMETEDGGILYYGTVCGAKAAKFGTVKEFKSAAKQAEIDNKNAALAELRATEEYKTMDSYRGSVQHGLDMDEKGFSYVRTLFIPCKEKAVEIAAKYKLKYLHY